MNSTSGRKNQPFYTILSLVRQSQKFNASVIAPAATHYARALGQRLAGNPWGARQKAPVAWLPCPGALLLLGSLYPFSIAYYSF